MATSNVETARRKVGIPRICPWGGSQDMLNRLRRASVPTFVDEVRRLL